MIYGGHWAGDCPKCKHKEFTMLEEEGNTYYDDDNYEYDEIVEVYRCKKCAHVFAIYERYQRHNPDISFE